MCIITGNDLGKKKQAPTTQWSSDCSGLHFLILLAHSRKMLMKTGFHLLSVNVYHEVGM